MPDSNSITKTPKQMVLFIWLAHHWHDSFFFWRGSCVCVWIQILLSHFVVVMTKMSMTTSTDSTFQHQQSTIKTYIIISISIIIISSADRFWYSFWSVPVTAKTKISTTTKRNKYEKGKWDNMRKTLSVFSCSLFERVCLSKLQNLMKQTEKSNNHKKGWQKWHLQLKKNKLEHHQLDFIRLKIRSYACCLRPPQARPNRKTQYNIASNTITRRMAMSTKNAT